MAGITLYTQEAATNKATTIKTALATSKLRLFKSGLALSEATSKADLVAAEADFDGYPAGGYAIAAFTGPLDDPNGGSILTAPVVEVAYGPAGDPPVTNTIAGWWLEDSTGKVRLAGTIVPNQGLNVVGDGFNIVVQDSEGRNT